MAEAGSKGQRDKAATEAATAAGAAQDEADARVRAEESSGKRAEELRAEAASAADLSTQLTPEATAVDPFPAYDELDLEALRKLAKDRDVEINRDVEKAQLVHELREHDRKHRDADTPAPANYDLMGLEEVRELAADRGVELDPDFERAHLVTELRAADTSTR